jgi:hypothetical protein
MCHSADWQREAQAREAHKRRNGVINDLRTKATKPAETQAETAKKDRPEPVLAK